MKFSIITPVYLHSTERALDFDRCLKSVENQTLKDYEHIIVNDGSPVEIIRLPSQTSVYKQKHLERIYALRLGLKKSVGEWICFLDSDDTYMPHYLKAVSKMIEENPDQKMFNFGSLHVHTDYEIHARGAFRPKKKKVGHEIFGGGNIVNGTFVVHRSVFEDLGAFPEADKLWNPWDFSDAFQKEFPETKKYFTIDHKDHPKGLVKELGNPWGNDYALFYRYTRKYHSLPMEQHLYVVYNK